MANPPSTRNLATLPDIDSLRKRMQQMAALAAVVGEGVAEYEFHPQWTKRQQMGAFKNGSGDELFVHFTPAGCFIKGFAHESTMTPYRVEPRAPWPGVFDGVPTEFASSLKEPAFDIPSTTFVVWRLAMDPKWKIGPVKFPKESYGDGSKDLLGRLVLSSQQFTDWLTENYEAEVDGEIVAAVFEHKPLTKDQLRTLQPSAKVADSMRAVNETGYPLA